MKKLTNVLGIAVYIILMAPILITELVFPTRVTYATGRTRK